MPESKSWEAALDKRLDNLAALFPSAFGLRSIVAALVTNEIQAAYQRGLMAGRSQANYPTRRKKKESDPCTASAAGPTPASPTAPAGEPPEGSAP